MEWWTHLWLNEGFATWIEYLCVDHTHPEYDIWTNFLSREYASGMSLDALANSHPIEVILLAEKNDSVVDHLAFCPRRFLLELRLRLNRYLTPFLTPKVLASFECSTIG